PTGSSASTSPERAAARIGGIGRAILTDDDAEHRGYRRKRRLTAEALLQRAGPRAARFRVKTRIIEGRRPARWLFILWGAPKWPPIPPNARTRPVRPGPRPAPVAPVDYEIPRSASLASVRFPAWPS